MEGKTPIFRFKWNWGGGRKQERTWLRSLGPTCASLPDQPYRELRGWQEEEAGEKKWHVDYSSSGHQEKHTPSSSPVPQLWCLASKPCGCDSVFSSPTCWLYLTHWQIGNWGKVNSGSSWQEAAVTSRWMAVIQKHGKSSGSDLFCHKENLPPDKIGVPGCHKKRPEGHNWSR